MFLALAIIGGAAFGIWKFGFPAQNGPALEAIETFHEQLNERKYDEIYDSATPGLRKGMFRKDFVDNLSTIREKLGTQVTAKITDSHSLESSTQTVSFLTCTSQFEGGTAVEFFTFAIAGNKPVLESYKVASQLLEPKRVNPADRSPEALMKAAATERAGYLEKLERQQKEQKEKLELMNSQ